MSDDHRRQRDRCVWCVQQDDRWAFAASGADNITCWSRAGRGSAGAGSPVIHVQLWVLHNFHSGGLLLHASWPSQPCTCNTRSSIALYQLACEYACIVSTWMHPVQMLMPASVNAATTTTLNRQCTYHAIAGPRTLNEFTSS